MGRKVCRLALPGSESRLSARRNLNGVQAPPPGGLQSRPGGSVPAGTFGAGPPEHRDIGCMAAPLASAILGMLNPGACPGWASTSADGSPKTIVATAIVLRINM